MYSHPCSEPVEIIADDREPETDVVDCLRCLDSVSVRIERLRTGDYLANRQILFERKTLPDFARSIVDGRLFKQMMRLAGSNHVAVLILEGTGRSAEAIGVRREALQGALITVSVILHIPVLRSMAPDETARLIVYAARQVQSPGKAGYPRPGYRPKTRNSRRLYILQGLPGVGHERAARLLDKFGSVEAVMGASREELQTVAGIGQKTADRIRWAIGEQSDPYGGEVCPDI
jgi:ERCC4-type nuclease